MCVCLFYFCLRFTVVFLARDSLFLISYRFSTFFLLYLDLCGFIFLSLLFIFFLSVNYLQSELVAALLIFNLSSQNQRKKSHRVKFILKKYKKKRINIPTVSNYEKKMQRIIFAVNYATVGLAVLTV